MITEYGLAAENSVVVRRQPNRLRGHCTCVHLTHNFQTKIIEVNEIRTNVYNYLHEAKTTYISLTSNIKTSKLVMLIS